MPAPSADGEDATVVRRDADLTVVRPAPGTELTRRVDPVPDDVTRSGAPPATSASAGELPGDLGRRWERVREISVGGEAVLLGVRARRPAGSPARPGSPGSSGSSGPDVECVLKLYATAFDANRRGVWALVKGLHHRHLLALKETGDAGGHDYELAEYFPGGTLDDLMRSGADPGGSTFGAWPLARIRQLVDQVGSALAALHAAAMIHRDVKPANLLVRGTAPLDLVLGDYGISRCLDVTGRHTTAAGTPHYQGPESQVAGKVWDSPARDYWALGVIVLELATGRRLFRGVKEEVLIGQVALRGVDSSGIADPRLRLLCQGLLTRDYQHRWGAAEVRAWLAGDTPALVDPEPGRLPLVFNGVDFTDPRLLAAAITASDDSWDAAARRFLTWMGDSGGAGEGWRQLEVWLRDRRGRSDEELAELLDHHLRPSSVPMDAKVFQLVRWLDPAAPPAFRGVVLTTAGLRQLGLAAERDRAARERVRALVASGVLDLLGAEPGGPGTVANTDLADVGRRWRAAESALRTRPGQLSNGISVPGDRPGFGERRREATALALAADPVAAEQFLRDFLRPENQAMGGWAPRWWPEMGRRVAKPGAAEQPDPDAALDRAVSLQTMRLYLDRARQAADQARQKDEAARLEAENRERLWQAEEVARLRGRARAVIYAIAWVALWLGAGIGLLVVHLRVRGAFPALILQAMAAGVDYQVVLKLLPVWDFGPLQLIDVAAPIVVVSMHFWREARLADEQGRDYWKPASAEAAERARARQQRLDRMAQALRAASFGARIRRGLLFTVLAVLLILVMIGLPVLLQVLELLVLTRGIALRRHRWRAAHARHRAAVLPDASRRSANRAGGRR